MGNHGGNSVRETEFDVSGGRLFGLRAKPSAPRARVIALHGGGYDANYWHHPAAPELSLLDCGAALGFDMIAVDRPGTRRSQAAAPGGASVAQQVDMLFDLIEREADVHDLPVFLVGHSLGGITALTMAADPRAGRLRGVETAGTPLVFTPAADEGMRQALEKRRAAGEIYLPAPKRDMLEAMFFGPAGRYAPDVVAWGPTEHGAGVEEIFGVLDWIDRLDDILPRIAIPVHWTFARHEVSSVFDEASQPRVAALLAGNPFVRFAVQEGSAHNISLHHVGRAYHLKVLAFCEEALAL